MSATEALDSASAALTNRYRKGPVKKEPGTFYASADDWWFNFWNQFSPRGKDNHELEEDLVNADSPEKKRAMKAAHEMTTMELERYVQQKHWTAGGGNHKKKDEEDYSTSVGDQMLRDVIRKELQARGKTVYF